MEDQDLSLKDASFCTLMNRRNNGQLNRSMSYQHMQMSQGGHSMNINISVGFY